MDRGLIGDASTQGEVWWVAFDPSVGGEIQKTRPALVISNNAANAALNRVIVIPMTSQISRSIPVKRWSI